jgi:tripartite-type tricarboxylate transporter receptor subunit TctC
MGSCARWGSLPAPACPASQTSRRSPETPALAAYDLVNWYGLFAPAGTPAAAQARLHAAAMTALRDPELVRKLAEQGAEAAPTTPDAFRAFVAEETAKLGKLIRDANIHPDN